MKFPTRFALLALVASITTAQAAIVIEDRSLSTAPPVSTAPTTKTVSTTAAPTAQPSETNTTDTHSDVTSNDVPTAWDTYNTVQRLQDEVAQLNGKIEQQGFLIEKLQSDLRSRYLDLDQRLNNLQQSPQKPPASDTSASSTTTTAPGIPASSSIEEERKAYLAAYEMFQSGGSDKAIPPMLAFVNRYPQSSFTPGAYYWLGEFYLNASKPDTANARKNFEIVLDKYPDNSRAPAALYKVGSILDLQGKPQEAEQKMKELLSKYPKSSEAVLAQGYIKALETAAKAATPTTPATTEPAPSTPAKAPSKAPAKPPVKK
jgi:tol-pal system protein YbgF